MLRKILTIGMVMSMCFGVFSGCAKEKPLPYNARIAGGGILEDLNGVYYGSFKESFVKENTTRGAHYRNENWDPGDETSEQYLVDETSPKYRLYVVADQETYDNIFRESQEIDFDNKMYLVYIFTDTYRRQVIKNIKYIDKALTIHYITESTKPGYADGTMPIRKSLIVYMDKLEVESVEFVKLFNRG